MTPDDDSLHPTIKAPVLPHGFDLSSLFTLKLQALFDTVTVPRKPPWGVAEVPLCWNLFLAIVCVFPVCNWSSRSQVLGSCDSACSPPSLKEMTLFSNQSWTITLETISIAFAYPLHKCAEKFWISSFALSLTLCVCLNSCQTLSRTNLERLVCLQVWVQGCNVFVCANQSRVRHLICVLTCPDGVDSD